jgi:hypothetical protein
MIVWNVCPDDCLLCDDRRTRVDDGVSKIGGTVVPVVELAFPIVQHARARILLL